MVAHTSDQRPDPQRVSEVVARSGLRPPLVTRTALALHPKQRQAFRRLLIHLAFEAWLRGLRTWHYDWDCIALAETGENWQMHGSSYSSGIGVMNQAVRENATADVADRVFAGRASKAEQVAIGERIAARFGIRAWAAGTVDKCT